MFRPKLGYNQKLMFDLYVNCKLRSKKNHGLPPTRQDSDVLTPDEQLVHFMLENSSLTDSNPESTRCFHKVAGAISNICKQLCPGAWCKRGHCKSFSLRCAYNCGAGKRPDRCKEYQNYLRRKEEKELNRNEQ